MSEVKVNKISPRSGTAVTLGDSGDKFTVPSGSNITINSGASITNDGTATGFDTDTNDKVKVSTNDTTPGFLNGKLVAGTNITLTEGSDGGNETLTAALSGTIPTARLGTGTADATTFLRGDQTYASATPADGSITLAKMASGTDGNIISYDTSGNPVAVATGSSGQILTSAGAGAPPTFADPAGETNNICFRAGLTSGAVSLGTGGGYVTIPCNSEFFDQGGCYNNTGSTVTLNGLSAPAWSFCPNRAGKYLVFGGATMYYQNSTLRWGNIKIGGSATAAGNARSGHDSSANYGYSMNPSVSDIVQLNGTGDYITINARAYAGGSAPEMESGSSHCYFGAVFLTSN